MKSHTWGTATGTNSEFKIPYDREVKSIFFYSDWAHADRINTRLQFIELTLDEGTKVKIGTETAAITAAIGAATYGTISNGA